MNLPSVIVSLVLFAICLPTMLAGYSRATATIWDAKAEQQAVAVAAWHAVSRQQNGCDERIDVNPDEDADGDRDFGNDQDNRQVDGNNDGDYDDPTDYWQVDGIKALVGGDKFLPHDGFSVSCAHSQKIAWPPPVTPTYPPAVTTVPVPVLSVTTEWAKLNGTARSLSLTVLEPPS